MQSEYKEKQEDAKGKLQSDIQCLKRSQYTNKCNKILTGKI